MSLSRILGNVALGVICLSRSTSAFSLSTRSLFERSSGCASSTFSQCAGTGLPSDFCCPSTSTCVTLYKNTTVLCCPVGSTCTTIEPITCDIQQQNSTAHPDGLLRTTALNSTLKACGSACCPLGFSCTATNQCAMDANQQFVQASTTSNSPTTTPSSSTSSPITSSFSLTEGSCNTFPPTAVITGFFPGLILGALLATAAFCIIGARRRHHHRLSSTFSRSSPHVSSPIYQEGSGMRTDFLRKPTPSSSSTPSTPTRQPTIQRVRSLFRKSAAATGLPVTPRPRPRMPAMRREPSSESINIFADPSTARNFAAERASRQTTFTEMMDRADLGAARRGEPFVPMPASAKSRRVV